MADEKKVQQRKKDPVPNNQNYISLHLLSSILEEQMRTFVESDTKNAKKGA